MTTLVLGASGATGRWLVRHLLQRGHDVRAIVRSAARFAEAVPDHEQLDVTEANLLGLKDEQLQQHVKGVSAIGSCLGHNLTFKGVYGQPRRLVTDAARRLCEAANAMQPDRPMRYVLMSSAGVQNRDLNERVSLAQRAVIGLIRLLLPPHPDNEAAADYLRTQIGPKDQIVEWVAVRPDSLVDADRISEYDLHESPTRSPIFNPGKTSRINVAEFMARLMTEDELWQQWRGRMPVIYNCDDSQAARGLR